MMGQAESIAPIQQMDANEYHEADGRLNDDIRIGLL